MMPNELFGIPIIIDDTVPKGEIILGEYACPCEYTHMVFSHWYCMDHGWVLCGRMQRRIKITGDLAKDYGWTVSK